MFNIINLYKLLPLISYVYAPCKSKQEATRVVDYSY